MSRALVAGAILGAALIFGGLFIQGSGRRNAQAATASLRLLDEVMARLREDYVDTMSIEEMYRRTASGFVKEVDDSHGELLTPQRYRQALALTRSRTAGVGIDVDIRDGVVTVIAAAAGSPADSAGIRSGDLIMAIDGKSTLGLGIEEVETALRGQPGSTVKLTLDRPGIGLTSEHPVIPLTRRAIETRPVRRIGLANGVGYVELAAFDANAAADLRRVVDSLRARGARSLILDLRRNAGGPLDQGVAVAELFLDPGAVVASTRGRSAALNQTFRDRAPQPWSGMPVVALTDSGSASAAEIVAGALKDNRRAVLVGAPTFGKGSTQTIFPMQGGYAVRLTTARWFTPGGHRVEGDTANVGIAPDVGVSAAAIVSGGAQPPDATLLRAMELLAGVTTTQQLIERARRK
ncbi:MAG TPA: S41 family peptidase [Gemmatimonadaceae bacterium]|nr:S41 family peptidase [Gemmatimonadaceae bacterium]